MLPTQNGHRFPNDIFLMHFGEWKCRNFDSNTSTINIIASLVAPGKLLENDIHKKMMNTYVLLQRYDIMYVTLSCFVWFAGNKVTTTWSVFQGVNQQHILALVQIMAWHQLGNKPLSEPMMV